MCVEFGYRRSAVSACLRAAFRPALRRAAFECFAVNKTIIYIIRLAVLYRESSIVYKYKVYGVY